MKKSKLKCALLGAIATLSFIACNTSTTPEAAKTETQKPTETPAPVQQKEYKSTDLLKFNLTGAKALGTVFENSSSSNQQSVRTTDAAENQNGLLKFDKDGKASSVIENAVEGKELDFSKLPKIMEIKRNPHSNIPQAAKGTYITFEKPLYEITDKNGNDLHYFPQLVYAKPDGQLVDLSNWITVYTSQTEWLGYDYIEFANDGRAFFALYDWDADTQTDNAKIYVFNPADNSVKEIPLGITKTYHLDNFRINDDGSWIFFATREECKKENGEFVGILHVYAIPTDNPGGKISLYKQATDEKILTKLSVNYNKTYRISKICYDSITKNMYFWIGTSGPLYLTDSRRIYKWDNGYSANNVDFYQPVYDYMIRGDGGEYDKAWFNYYKNDCGMSDNEVYAQIAKNIKNYCDLKHCDYNPGSGSSDDIEINLSVFKDMAGYEALYDADAKDDAAVKKILENWDLFKDYSHTKYFEEMKEKGFKEDGEDFWFNILAIEKICFLKNAEGNATTTSAFAQQEKWLCEARYCQWIDDYISLKNGCWIVELKQVYSDAVHGIVGDNYAYINQLTDKDGNYIFEIPDALKDVKGAHKDNNDIQRQSNDPWYKPPYSISEEGFALINHDRNDIYYFDGTNCKELLKTGNLVCGGKFYTVSCENGMVYFTAKATDGSWINKGINPKDGTVFNINTEKRLSSIVSVE